jgi:hypothetical protein
MLHNTNRLQKKELCTLRVGVDLEVTRHTHRPQAGRGASHEPSRPPPVPTPSQIYEDHAGERLGAEVHLRHSLWDGIEFAPFRFLRFLRASVVSARCGKTR